MKQSLLFLPFIGFGCWGLDFTFIKRFSRKELKVNPNKIQQQHQYIDEKCQIYKQSPSTIINFVEGTRNNPSKKNSSSYNNLLPPQPVGLSLLIKQIQPKTIIDVSLVYPEGKTNFFEIFFKREYKIIIAYRVLNIGDELSGNYRTDKEFRKKFHAWLKKIWQEKDHRLTKIKSSKESALAQAK